MPVTFVSSNSVSADERGQQRTDGRGRKSDNSFITDLPDSNRFHRLLLLDYALRPQRARTITLWYGTPVGIRREELPDVVKKERSSGLVARGVASAPGADPETPLGVS